MTFEVLEQLETKIQSAVETIGLLQMELAELKEVKNSLALKNDQLVAENEKLAHEHQQWQSRLSALLGKIDQAEDGI